MPTKEQMAKGFDPKGLSDEKVNAIRADWTEMMKDGKPTMKSVGQALSKKHGVHLNTIFKYCNDLKPKWARGRNLDTRKRSTRKAWESRKRKEAETLIKQTKKEKERLAETESKVNSAKNQEVVRASNMRNRVVEVCNEKGHDPIAVLVDLAMRDDPLIETKDRISLNKYLVDKLVPNVKSIDIQQDVRMNVAVEVKKFGPDTSVINIDDMRKAAHADMPSEEEYAKFYEGDEENKADD